MKDLVRRQREVRLERPGWQERVSFVFPSDVSSCLRVQQFRDEGRFLNVS